jgi:hypothetical protein
MARIRRMRRSRLAFFGLVMAGVVLMWGVSSAAESTPNGTAVYDGIKAFTDQAQQLADQGVLDDAMALTDLDPSGPSGLDLEKAFRDVVGSLPATFKELDPAADPAAVAVELEKLDLEGASAAALKVSTGCPKTGACTDYTPVTASYSAPIATMNVPITIERTVAVPVNLSVPLNSGSLKVEGTTVNVALKLTGTLPLRLDTSKVTTEPTKAFYVAGTPTFTATVNTSTDATGVSVAAKLGFTDLTATLRNVTAALSMTAQLRDPDADGIVTKDEFSTASLTDMFTIGRTGSAAGTLDLDTTLTATAPDFTVPFTDNLADGFTFPQIDPAALNPFRNVTPEQVISGFGQAAAALSGAQKVGDVDLPFLDGALSDVMSVSQPMFDFVNQQAVVCGTAEQTPPTGEVPDIVTSGTSVFCQAFVIHDPAKYTVTNVTWHVGTGVSATYDATPTQTDKNKSVAITPSKHAKFTMTADDAFDAYATYDLAVASGAPSGTTAVTGLTTQRPARTAQQLALKLNELGGFLNQADLVTAVGAGAKVLDYDPATKALTFRLRKTFTPPAGKLGVDFGDQLEKSTGIIALGASGGAGVTVNATGVGLDVTIGVLLGQLSNIGEGQPCADPTVMDPPGSSTPALANTTACPANQLDRFFVRTDPAADKPEVFVGDGSVTGTLPTLTGRLGFLSLEATPSAFTLAKKVAADPLLRVDVTTPSGGVAVGPTASVANAIRLRQLLFSLGTYVSPPQINLKFDGTLTAVAKVGNEVPQTTLGTGTVTVAWPDITVGLPTVSVDSSFTDNLKGFNIDPNLFGKHSGATSPSTAPSPTTPAVLTDAVATFTDEVLGQRLENLTDGSFCSVTERTGTTLTCATGLAGGTVNKWRANDEYRVLVGDPLALLWKLLDNMDTVIGGIDGISGGVGAGAVYEKELPFVGVSPKALVRQLTDLKRAATEMRGGPQATIACGLTNANPPTGDPSQLSLATDASKDIFCQVETQKDASAVTWTVPQGGGATPTLTNASDTATVVTPTTATPKTSKITILGSSSDGGHIRSSEHPLGYAVRATFTDEDGEHVVDFPEQSVPVTLQDFEAMLESKLGLPAGAFKILPEGTGATRRMKLDLNYGICGYAGATAPALCTSGAKHLPSFSAPLNVDLGATGGLVGAGAAADVSVTYAADARLAMSFAVSSSLDPKVEPETGITVKGRFNAANVNLSANLGPFGVQAGTGGGKPGGGVGVLKVGADFKLGNPSATAVSVGSYASGLTGTFTAPTGMGEDCGKIDMLAAHTPEDTDDQSVSGLACGRLSLGLSVGDNVEYIDDVAFKVGALAPDGGFTVTTYIPAQVGTRLADEVLSWDTLLNSLPELLARLEEGLKASSGSGPDGQKIPLIGDALDAGADVVGTVNDEVVPLAQNIGDYIDAALVDCSDPNIECENDPPGCTPGDDGCTENATKEADPTDVERFIGDFIWSELGHDADGLELIRKNAGTAADGERSDVKVTTYCDLSQTPCEATDSLFDIKDVRLTFNIGQAIGTDAENPPAFDIGFDGVPLRVAGAVEAEAGWNLLVDVGLSLAEGPYLVVVDPATPGYDGAGEERPPELFVNAKVQLGAESTTDEICNSEVNDPTGGPAATAISTFSVSSNRCLAGRLGFVSVNMRDESTDAKRTKATIETSLDLRKKDDLDATELTVINFTDLVSGKLKPVAKLKVGAQVNLRFRTGISGTQSAGFPTVLGTFNLDWEFVKSFGGTVTDSATTPLTLGFADIHLDVSAFFNKYLKPTLNEVRNVMGPFKPIIDTLNAPLPVISDLAALVGQPPVTLMGLMELLAGNNLTVIKSLAKFISFAVELANNESFAEGLIPLGPVSGGAFALKSGLAQRKSLGSNPGPSAAQTLINKAGAAYKAGTNLLEKPSLGGGNTAAVAKAKQTGAGLTRDNLPGTFGVPGLTFPFMSDASQIFGFIMGQDVTLVRYDVGTLRATAGFAYNFGPFMIGPVPVTAGIGGSVTLEGRFALGYDTSGLRKVLSGGSGTHLFDGIYIDDLDTNMVDVPEIKLVGEVYARAGITVFVATAGIEGGIRLTIALNLDDRPEPDGKLRIEEIFNKLSNPICLFDVSGKLEAYLKAFVEIN